MYNPNTYDWCQCDPETYDSGTPPDEQMATEPVQAEEDDGQMYCSCGNKMSEAEAYFNGECDRCAFGPGTCPASEVVFWGMHPDGVLNAVKRHLGALGLIPESQMPANDDYDPFLDQDEALP